MLNNKVIYKVLREKLALEKTVLQTVDEMVNEVLNDYKVVVEATKSNTKYLKQVAKNEVIVNYNNLKEPMDMFYIVYNVVADYNNKCQKLIDVINKGVQK